MPITPLLLAIPLLLPAELGRWIETHDNLGGVRGVAAMPTGGVAILDSDREAILLQSEGNTTTLNLGQFLHQPQGLSVAADGRLYVADTGHHSIMFFDQDGRMLGGFGGRGEDEYRLLEPHDVCVGPTFVAVADTGNNRIQVYEPGGAYIQSIEGPPGDPLRRPEGITIDSQNRIWVADTQNHCIRCFNSKGLPVHRIGSWGTFPGQFMEPSGIDAADDYIIVTDRLNHRVQVLDISTGVEIESWGMHSFLPRQGEGRVHYPADVAVLSDGDIVVAEPFEERVQRFGVTGIEIDKPTPSPPSVQSHFGPVAATDGRFFCTWEPELRAIHLFDLDRRTPLRLSTFGTPGTAPGQLGDLSALAIDAESKQLWAVDATNARVHQWNLNPPPPDKPRFDPSMATLTRSIPLPQAGPGDLIPSGDRLLFLDRNQAVAWDINDDGLHTQVDLNLGRDPITGIAVVDEMTGEQRFATLDALNKIIQLHGTWPHPGENGNSISVQELHDPVDIARLSDNSIVVVDRAGHRVHRFAIDGTELAAWGTRGGEHGQLWRPAAVVVDHQDRVIVLDHGNHRAQMFKPDGTWIMTFGAGRAWTTRPSPQASETESN
jgi:tripartite motif-containing protein 71